MARCARVHAETNALCVTRDMESVQDWSRKSRDKLTTLDDLETRVRRLLTRLSKPPRRALEPARDEIAAELAALGDDDEAYSTCMLCGQQFLTGCVIRACHPCRRMVPPEHLYGGTW